MSVNIKITNVRKGSDKQLAIGIQAIFTVDIHLDDGSHFLSMRDMKLRSTKEGKLYIQHPYREYGEGDDKKKIYFHYMYPGADDRDAQMDKIIHKVQEMVNSGGTTAAASTSNASSGGGSNIFFGE
jgi:hypothetical protein